MPRDVSDLTRFDHLGERFQGPQRYALLDELREADTPLAVDEFGRVHLLRHDDVRAAFADPTRFRNGETRRVVGLGATCGPLYDWQSNALIVANPPRHTAMRRALHRLDSRLARRMTDVVREQAHALVDDLPSEGVVDLVERFTARLPIAVLARMLGLPPDDEAVIAELSPGTLPKGPHDLADADRVNARFRRFVEDRIGERRAAPRPDDVVTDLISAADAGDLTPDELWATLQTLLLAGHESTSSALVTGVHALLAHPSVWASLGADRTLLPNAAEEILRWDPPAENMVRVLGEDVVLHGVTLPTGTLVALSIASANHDPRVFDRPDEFDVRRPDAHRHLAFGLGLHRCSGAALALVELPVALEVLLDRLAEVRIVEQPTYASGFFRRFDELRLRVVVRDGVRR